jgi:hypothetical protein
MNMPGLTRLPPDIVGQTSSVNAGYDGLADGRIACYRESEWLFQSENFRD